MKLPAVLLAASLSLLTLAAGSLPADEFDIDNSHTSVVFRISHMGFSNTYGRFNKVGGKFTLEPEKPEASTFQVAIDAGSIDTNDATRDKHLRAPDFLNTSEFPAITFKSTKVAPRRVKDGIVLDVTGDLTMHGVTQSITLEMTKLGEGPGPMGDDFRAGFDGQTTIKRSEFGMDKMINMIGDEVTIMISFEGVRKEGAAAKRPARQPRRVVASKPATKATAVVKK